VDVSRPLGMARGPVSQLPIFVMAGSLNQPDDLLFHDDQLYVGELGAGKIHVLSAGRSPQVLPVTIPKVEGMVFLNGTLYAAGQQEDRVVAVEGASVRTVLQLAPVSGQDGVDGISATGQQLLVPDSPRGVLDWVDPNGSVVRSLGGFLRPTGAWPLPDGSILVADEYGNAAVKVGADGSKSYLVRNLPIVDDIGADSAGDVFVVRPVAGGGALDQVSGGSARNIIGGMGAPQGLAFDGANNIFVSEEDAGRVDLAVRTFKLNPVAAAGAGAGKAVCIDLVRAPGFAGEVTLSGDAGLVVRKQPGIGTRGEVVLRNCGAGGCRLVAQSGSLRDVLWVGGQA
jgi:hypothetical protein